MEQAILCVTSFSTWWVDEHAMDDFNQHMHSPKNRFENNASEHLEIQDTSTNIFCLKYAMVQLKLLSARNSFMKM